MLSNAKIKYIRSLAHKKHRKEKTCFIAEGNKIVTELLEQVFVYNNKRWNIKEIFCEEEYANHLPISVVSKLQQRIQRINHNTMERISGQDSPQQTLAIVEIPTENQEYNPTNDLVLMLDDVQDPGNMGSIIRSADWFGVSTIICSPRCTDVFSPKVVQASMGSVFRVNVIYSDLKKVLEAEKNRKKVFGTVLQGKDIRLCNKNSNAFIIMGNEARGIDSSLQHYIEESITIPLHKGRNGNAESLNIAMATSIVLYEFRR